MVEKYATPEEKKEMEIESELKPIHKMSTDVEELELSS